MKNMHVHVNLYRESLKSKESTLSFLMMMRGSVVCVKPAASCQQFAVPAVPTAWCVRTMWKTSVPVLAAGRSRATDTPLRS